MSTHSCGWLGCDLASNIHASDDFVPLAVEQGRHETYTVQDIRAAWERHAHPDDWGVLCFYLDGLLAALRGEYDKDERP
jgi:hypothetical protein